jgi:predicted homoserine dehydrogenase-like protein
MLLERAAANRPLRVGMIGAGKFGSMYLAQAKHTPGIHSSLARTGWPADRYTATSFSAAVRSGTTFITEDAQALLAAPEIDIVIEATGNPAAGIRHALGAFAHRKHVVMVNVEADALAGPLLSRKAAEAGAVYSLAYGDQPALICEMVDWCRAAVSYVDAGYGLAVLRIFAGNCCRRRLQRADVQFLSRRYEERDRNGRGRQCHRAHSGPGRSAFSAMRR